MKNLEFDDFVYQSIDGSKWNLDYDFEGETREYPFTWSMIYDEAERLYNLSPMKDGYDDVSAELFFHDVHYRRDFHKWFVELAQEHLMPKMEIIYQSKMNNNHSINTQYCSVRKQA